MEGLIRQWGESSSTIGTETITLPVTMSNTTYHIAVNVNQQATATTLAAGQFWYTPLFNFTAASFGMTKYCHNNGTGAGNSAVPRCWMVTGY